MQHCRIQRDRRTIDPKALPWFLSQLQEPFVGQTPQERADISQNLVARRCVALADQLGESDLASAALNDLGRDGIGLEHPSGEGFPACVAARAHHPPTPAGMSGSDSSTTDAAEPRTGAVNRPFRIDGSGDQNSAGKYPLISRPMQISTRVGVVHDMAIFLLGWEDNTPFLNARPLSAVKQHFA
jgi:hypothetical protein